MKYLFKNFMPCIILFTVIIVGCNSVNQAKTQIQTDIVILGATPGGITAAISAARTGHTVTLVEYHNTIGGMMASGLGKSDIEDRDMIQGIFKEFVDRVYEYYVREYGKDHENVKLCKDGYYYEPSVAEMIFEKMLQEQTNIKLLKGWKLESTQLTNNKLTTIVIAERQSGKLETLNAHVFIDATYEGDLYASSGAKYRIGRESRAEYDEPHAGMIYFDYQEKKILPGSIGEADDRLPAYTYRLCLTTDPNNAHKLTSPPPEYDRQNYLGYFDDLEAGRLAGPKVFKPGRGYNPAHFNTLVRALSITNIPNNKTDVNMNPRPLGFPFAEVNKGYVEGDDDTRNRIRKRHKNLTLGLLWFLQNDTEVPSEHRKLANEFHLAKDEFLKSDNFPFQLYIREARRLVGEYTLTEKDITGVEKDNTPFHHVDNIAVGEFPIDCFPCRVRQPDDTVVLEGYLGMLDHITRPYEIPYRIMIPEKIDGLIVPVAASTSHIGYSSIRMEPTWMALGQAAGVAASISIDENVQPRNIPIKKLQKTLLGQGQVMEHKSSGDPHPIANPESPIMLKGSWVPKNPHHIDFSALPKIKSKHSIVSDVRNSNGVNQHNYIIHHDGEFLIMWSDGPGVEDRVGQRVAYAKSKDGLNWSEKKYITPYPPKSTPASIHYNTRSDDGFRYISRGFWKRGNELLALVSLDEGNKFFGRSLELRAFKFNSKNKSWKDIGLVYDNTINNFPPKLLPNGEWMMTRRTFDRNVFMLTGGIDDFDQWESHPVVSYADSDLTAEEPYWWVLPDNNLLALFRDNARSGYLFRAFSSDKGRTWTKPVRTNFPDARSKFNGLQLKDGRFILVSNPNPKKRDPLALSISDDGIVFDKMGYLFGERRIDYPHAIEHDGYLFIAFSGGKQSVEVLKVKVSELDKLKMPPVPLDNTSRKFLNKTVIDLDIDTKNKEFHYTLNGSIPTKDSPLYKNPVPISETTQFNIVELYNDGKISTIGYLTYTKWKSLKPVIKTGRERGLKFEYFELDDLIHSTDDLSKVKLSKKGSVEKFTFPYQDKQLSSNFGLKFSGYIEIPMEDIYTFGVSSNDGSKLFIAGKLVVDNDGGHGATLIHGEIALKAGIHKINLEYFQAGGAKELQVFIKGGGIERKEIDKIVLTH
jgi:hypothetical protein